ncbi:drug/metabolite transporter (DMT)-like permease [Methanocalculus alkaliphilus]|uniref:DMT family transporter n=1 Tax=Methanocalculus alkaliphilus TaxID=768730 RepID=UPI00209E5D97|nr:DMT family transporter [Methanocalculus alkaliphilus]MCP1714783.1 drug/metabolite transporter (DMT)-like permease [Methanocalculus alkaliphilus]
MIWFFFALGGALSQAAYATAVKILLRRTDPFLLAGCSFLAASGLLCIISLFFGIPSLGPELFPSIGVTVCINILATILLYHALGTSDISLCMPMLAFTPVFLIGTSFLILGEIPTIAGACGILFVASGAYFLTSGGSIARCDRLAAPFHRLTVDRGVLSMLLVAFLFSISVNYDKKVVENSDPVFGSAFVFLLLGSAFLLIALLSKRRGADLMYASLRAPLPLFIGVGVILAAEIVMINIAYTMSIVSYVITVKRLAIFFSVVAGITIFREGLSWGRITGALVMVTGAGMIALFG